MRHIRLIKRSRRLSTEGYLVMGVWYIDMYVQSSNRKQRVYTRLNYHYIYYYKNVNNLFIYLFILRLEGNWEITYTNKFKKLKWVNVLTSI